MGGADYTEYEEGKFATEVFIKGGSGNPFVFQGTVTTATSSTEFASTDLTEQGDDAFKEWHVYVFHDTGGVAPQGESQPISDYVSSTGTFTHTAFTTPLAVGDKVFILHPYEAIGGDATEAKQDTIISKVDAISGVTGIFHEQVDTPVTVNAILASETDIFDLSAASTRYIVRNLRLKSVDPGAETITVRLRELINDVSTIVDTFTIDNANFGTYHTLIDMFGVLHLAGDDIHITVQASAAGPYAITGQYSHAKTNV